MADEPLALALQALGRKERTVAELGSWLRARGVEEDAVGRVIDELVAQGTLDDARFARRYAEDKRELASWGSERIRAALLERGVAREDVEDAVADPDGLTELDRAVAALGHRDWDLAVARDRSRALGFLARRGFDAETAYEAIRRLGRD